MKKGNKFIKYLAVAALFFSAYSCFNDPVNHVSINYTQAREDSIIGNVIDSLTSHGYNIDTTDLGIYYTILSEGDSIFAQPGDSVGIIYTGFMADGTGIFDQSASWYQDSIWRYVYRSNNLIPGFDDAIGHLTKGAEGMFLLPSSLAYGPSGSRNIPPYSPLLFDIKLVDIYKW